MTPAEDLAATIPDVTPSLDRAALELWLRRQGMTRAQLNADAGRGRDAIQARRLACAFLRKRGWSLPAIAREFHYADHTAVWHLLKPAG